MESVKRRLLGVLTLSLCAVVLGAQEQRLNEGSNVEFSCNYPLSYQNPRIEWKFSFGQDTTFIYYDGELTDRYKCRAKIFPQGLQLLNVSWKDEGEYTCEVTATHSLYTEIKTRLVVLRRPARN